jgi:hypothetical protein
VQCSAFCDAPAARLTVEPRQPCACSQRVACLAEGGSAQSIDPVLEHLMHNARSDAVRQEFLRGDLAELIDHHEIKLLVGNPYGLGMSTHMHSGSLETTQCQPEPAAASCTK